MQTHFSQSLALVITHDGQDGGLFFIIVSKLRKLKPTFEKIFILHLGECIAQTLIVKRLLII